MNSQLQKQNKNIHISGDSLFLWIFSEYLDTLFIQTFLNNTIMGKLSPLLILRLQRRKTEKSHISSSSWRPNAPLFLAIFQKFRNFLENIVVLAFKRSFYLYISTFKQQTKNNNNNKVYKVNKMSKTTLIQ